MGKLKPLGGCREGFHELCIAIKPLPANSHPAAPLPMGGNKIKPVIKSPENKKGALKLLLEILSLNSLN